MFKKTIYQWTKQNLNFLPLILDKNSPRISQIDIENRTDIELIVIKSENSDISINIYDIKQELKNWIKERNGYYKIIFTVRVNPHVEEEIIEIETKSEEDFLLFKLTWL